MKAIICLIVTLLFAQSQAFDIYKIIEDYTVGFNEGMWDIRSVKCEGDIKESMETVKVSIEHFNLRNYAQLI